MIQGGFYHEKLNDLYPHTDSWATEFVVSYSNYSTTGFQLYKNDNGNVKVVIFHSPFFISSA